MATQMQSVGNEILNALKFEILPELSKDGHVIIGGEQKFKATSETVGAVQLLRDQNQVLVLDSDGAIRFEDGGDAGPPSLPR